MITVTAADNAPTTCPFGTGERRTVKLVRDLKSPAGNLIAAAGTITYAWDDRDAGDPRLGTPSDSVSIWTPDHYANVEWTCIRPTGRIVNV